MSGEEKKKKETGHGIYQLDNKYFCEECDHEVHWQEECPTCLKPVDWDRISLELHRVQ